MRSLLLWVMVTPLFGQDPVLEQADRLSHAKNYPALAQLLTQPDALFRLDAAGRLPYLLQALTAQQPLTEAAAKAIRASNAQGYFATNAHLLAANGSPVALQLWQSMLADPSVDTNVRIAVCHQVLPRNRHSAPLLAAARQVAQQTREAPLKTAIATAVFAPETIRLRPGQPALEPAKWITLPTPALREALALANVLSLPRHAQTLRSILAGRP